ncbi:MAG: nucleotidyltransferase domain-containing protein [Candidatus Heimdallarchaeota archaeon]
MLKIYEIGKERYKLIKKYKQYLEPIKSACLQLLPKAKIFLFGSALSGKLVAASDIDILIVTEREFKNQRERASIILRIEDKVSLPFVHPFEFHLMSTPEYNRFISITNAQLKEI